MPFEGGAWCTTGSNWTFIGGNQVETELQLCTPAICGRHSCLLQINI